MKRNLFATYLAQGWVALMGVVFVPVYIRFLGIEAYGLIGAFTALYAILVVLDFGVSPTLTREVSRFTAGAYTATQIRDLLRSAEVLAFTTAALVLAAFWLASDWVAASWFRTEALGPEQVSDAVRAMGLVAALRFVESIYRGTIIGLQQLVLFSAINAAAATLRALGAIAVLAFVSNSIEAFFLWQAVVSVASLLALVAVTYGLLPSGIRAGKPSFDAVRRVAGFATGMIAISVLSIALTQMDKLMLSNLLTLSDFGRYSLAALVAVSLELLAAPAFQALGPRFARLHAQGDEAAFGRIYHQGSQLVSILAGSAAMVLIVFAEPFLALWTQDPSLAEATAPLLQVLAAGYLLHLFDWMPYLAQLAYRWTSLTIRLHSVALVLMVPLLLWVVPRHGVIGAAWAWTALNCAYFILFVHFMHQRILRHEKWRWYGADILGPVAAALSAALLVRWIFPIEGYAVPGQLAVLALAAIAAVTAATASAPLYRGRAISEFRRILQAR